MTRLCAALLLLAAAAGTALAQEAPPPAEPPADFEPPELLEYVSAPYPAEAEAAGLEAVVVLEILVDETGASADVKVVTGAGHGFDEAAVAAAKQFKWKPGKAKGKPVKVAVTYEYAFTLTVAPPPPDEPPPPAGPKPGVLTGKVVQRGTRLSLGGADIAVTGESGEVAAAVVTEADGSFSIELPPGKYTVTIVLAEHKKQSYAETIGEGERVEVRYLLEAIDYDPYQSTIEAEADRVEVERKLIPAEEAKKIPGTRGDALRAVEAFPGVARPPAGIGILIVRGSNPEDTQSMIAGHWVPLFYHFGGLTSVVNSDLLESIEYLPGNFSAKYGRAIGGVVGADLRAPRKDRWSGYVDIDVIDAGFLLEGPVGGGGSLAIAGRRSYIDAFFSAVIPEDAGLDFTTAPVYWDYQVVYDTPAAGGRLRLIGYGLDDQLRFVFGDPAEIDPVLRGTATNHALAHRFNARWKRPLGKKTDLTLNYASGYGGFSASIGPAVSFDIRLWFNSYRAEIQHKPFDNVVLAFGTEGIAYPYEIQVRGPRPPAEGEVQSPPSANDFFAVDRTGAEWTPAFYMEAAIDAGYGLTLTPGARFDYYYYARATAVDPRFTARWVRGIHTVRFGFGRYSEQPQPYESDPTFGNPDVDPERALHLSAGYDIELTKLIKLETTVYYKALSDLIVRDDRLVMREDGTLAPVGYTNDGEGRVYGLELQVRHELSKTFFGWISYTLSRSERRDHPDEDARWRPFTFDQTHILTVVASWKLPWRLELGGRFRYTTGNPDTPIIGSIYDADADVYIPIPGESGARRFEAYHQLDVRLDRRWVFEGWMLTGYIDVQNAYNRQNPEGAFYSYDFRESVPVSGLPIIPSIGVKGEF